MLVLGLGLGLAGAGLGCAAPALHVCAGLAPPHPPRPTHRHPCCHAQRRGGAPRRPLPRRPHRPPGGAPAPQRYPRRAAPHQPGILSHQASRGWGCPAGRLPCLAAAGWPGGGAVAVPCWLVEARRAVARALDARAWRCSALHPCPGSQADLAGPGHPAAPRPHSRCSLADVAAKLGLASVQDTESIVAKAIR